MGLYCSRALRGLWGFCVREWLGGFGACSVFASYFLLLPFSLSFWLSFPALSLGVFGCCFLFPFGLYAKRKGVRVSSLRPLLSCCGALWVYYMLSAFLSVASFDFEKIHPAPQVRCALNLPPRVFKVSLIARVSPIIATAFSE